MHILQLLIPFHSMAGRFRARCHFQTSSSNDPKMTLNTERSKAPRVNCISTTKSKRSLRFTLWLAISNILAIFYFPIAHNDKFQSLLLKFEISKFQYITFVRTVAGAIQKKFCQNLKFCRKKPINVGGLAFWIFTPTGFHVNENGI